MEGCGAAANDLADESELVRHVYVCMDMYTCEMYVCIYVCMF
jgi:hypothetical protein